jgi:NADH dehydrogenase/NADH:ubiquinone oxidoreductase subunit G
MIKLHINDKKITAKKGESVLEAAQRNNIYIPTLCYYKGLSAYGGCRICLVEVEGYSRPVTACTFPVQEGMRVKTDSQLLKKLRRFNLQLILSEHPHACLICNQESECARYQECIQKTPITFGCKFCSSNGACDLQKLVESLDIKEIPFTFSHRKLEVEKHDPFFERDYNLCILCGRCVRVCNEMRGAGTLDFHHRGPATLVGTAFNLPHLETGCQFCGACVDICPTGALRDRYSKWRGLQDRWVKTSCALCTLGCSIKLNIREDNLVNSAPDDNQICVRGRYGIVPLVYHPKRITTPLLKKGNRLVQVAWETALDFLYTKLSEHNGKTGMLFSSQLTIEAINAIGDLKDNFIITTLPVDKNIHPFNLKEIKGEAAFIILNTDMVNDFSPLLLKLKAKIKTKPIFVVIDAIETQGVKMADFRLSPKPGKEQDLLNQLFAKKKTSSKSGVSAGDIAECKELLDNKNIYVLYNTFNIRNIVLPKHVQALPLTSMVNALPISKLHFESSNIELLQDKDIDCLYLIGTAPKLNRKYKTIVVQDCFLPAFDFDLFLPAATFAETNGSFVNIEGKNRKLRKAIEPPGQAKSDDWIIDQLHKKLQGSVRTGKIRKKKREENSKHTGVSKNYPLQLIVRENCYAYRGHTLANLLKGFERLRQDHCLWLNKSTAKKLKAQNNTEVTVVGKDMIIQLPVKISEQVPDNNVLMYAHHALAMIESQPVRIGVVKKQV